MRPLLIVGAGGHGREILSIIRSINAVAPTFDVRGVVSEAGDPHGLVARFGVPVLGSNDALAEHEGEYLLGVGDPASRRRLDNLRRRAKGAIAIHPTAIIGSDCGMNPGLVAFPQVVVTTNVTFGRHVHLNVGSSVSHDCVFGDYVTLSPGCHVSGNVRLEDDVTLGIGAVVRQGVTIGRGTLVGAGAVVVSDLPEGVTAVGVPARPVKDRHG